MDKAIIFIVVSVIITHILNSRGGEDYIRDKDTNELIFRFRSIVRWIALIGVLLFFLLMYKTVPEYLTEKPINWFGVIVMTSTSVTFLWFYIYVTLTHITIRENDRIIHRFPFWKKEIEFKDVSESVLTIDRGGGNFVVKGGDTKISATPAYVDHFMIGAKVKHASKHAKHRELLRS